MNGWFFASICAICFAFSYVVDQVLEQRRRETKTGEFAETEEEDE